jgi:hypothetical protein
MTESQEKNREPTGIWSCKERSLISDFKRLASPSGPAFELYPGITVVDPERFHAALAQDIEHGPLGPRARMGSVRRDLEAYIAHRGL